MKVYLLAATMSLALAARAQLHARAPDLGAPVVPLAPPAYTELYLSTSLATCQLQRPLVIPFAVAALPPRRYDYRPARRTGRRYEQAVRSCRRKNRRDCRDSRSAKRQQARREMRAVPNGSR